MKRRTNRGMALRTGVSKIRHYFRLSAYKKLKEQDLSDLEEKGFEVMFANIGKRAATNAINENKALGIPVTFWQDGWVVRRMPDGSIERLQQAAQVREKQFRKGTVLHVRKTH
ncbi:hypothetical protein [Chitinophaga sp. GbtcB8]|uniref:hypothetical protein n=1 Tax=Chitinophaga sp. GbtcB8 TaxID=2824753 RepID=UPI001C2F222D|nr:hypothetical protein [Chitinophaga sp. GbtcB8]